MNLKSLEVYKFIYLRKKKNSRIDMWVKKTETLLLRIQIGKSEKAVPTFIIRKLLQITIHDY